MQKLVRTIYPPHCLICRTSVQDEFRLCPECWSGFRFIGGTLCDRCGKELTGWATNGVEYCHTCMRLERAWGRGRAVLEYSGAAVQFMKAMKHGGREDFFRPAASWMLPYARLLIKPDTVIVPVPLHWTRFLQRRYNQAAGLAVYLGKLLGYPVARDALLRKRLTVAQKNMDFATRFKNLSGAIMHNPRATYDITKGSVLLIDDVMTSGATLNAATLACQKAGVKDISVLVLMRALPKVVNLPYLD